jgi:hypothetical protein
MLSDNSKKSLSVNEKVTLDTNRVTTIQNDENSEKDKVTDDFTECSSVPLVRQYHNEDKPISELYDEVDDPPIRSNALHPNEWKIRNAKRCKE